MRQCHWTCVAAIYFGKWKTAGEALTSPRMLWFSLLSPSSLGITATTGSTDSLQHQGTARKGTGEAQELTGDLKDRVISWVHPDQEMLLSTPKPRNILIPINTCTGFTQHFTWCQSCIPHDFPPLWLSSFHPLYFPFLVMYSAPFGSPLSFF